jgi:hypothetical protein
MYASQRTPQRTFHGVVTAAGPGAESRFAIGFVLGAGMAVGTVFTLFVVPALYSVIARQHAHDEPHAVIHRFRTTRPHDARF